MNQTHNIGFDVAAKCNTAPAFKCGAVLFKLAVLSRWQRQFKISFIKALREELIALLQVMSPLRHTSLETA